MSNNKAREYTSPILEELISEITPEEMKATEQKMLQELNKQSSIEWLFDQMAQLCEDYDNGKINYTNYVNRVKEAKAKAEEMHKQEIKTCMSVAFLIGLRSDDANYKAPYEDWEQYYNETFGK